MPAGPPLAPGGFPPRLTRLGTFPEGKIHRVTLALIHLNPCTSLHILQITLGKFQVLVKGIYGKVDITICCIGMAVLDQTLDNGNDVIDMFRCLGLQGRAQHPQPVHILIKGGNVAISNSAVVGPFLNGPVDDLVVDIGVIADVGHLIPGKLQVAVDHIKHDTGPGMADVAEVIDRNPADIHPHLAGDTGDEQFFFT